MANSPNVVREYQKAIRAGGFCARDNRGLIEVTGKDRAAWLNNLVTNVVKTLQPGEGNYAFATNVKGRVVFDLNILVLDDRLWLDVDRRQVETARQHLDRYIITEDVRLEDLTGKTERYAILGPQAANAASRLGLGNLAAMSQLQHVAGRIGSTDVRMIRHDFAGLPAVEIVAMGDLREARASLDGVAAQLQLAELSSSALEVLRIEAGIPASVDDIDDEVVPPETGQVERGISYHKGCYLGQEVIERMRSHGVLARKLVGLRVKGDDGVPRGAEVRADSATVGRVTSCCFSEALGGVMALGYVKTAHANPGVSLRIAVGEVGRECEVLSLPVRK